MRNPSYSADIGRAFSDVVPQVGFKAQAVFLLCKEKNDILVSGSRTVLSPNSSCHQTFTSADSTQHPACYTRRGHKGDQDKVSTIRELTFRGPGISRTPNQNKSSIKLNLFSLEKGHSQELTEKSWRENTH